MSKSNFRFIRSEIDQKTGEMTIEYDFLNPNNEYTRQLFVLPKQFALDLSSRIDVLNQKYEDFEG